VIASIPLLAVYGGLLFAFGEVDREDVGRFRRLFAALRTGGEPSGTPKDDKITPEDTRFPPAS
jgi:hypothetical protein